MLQPENTQFEPGCGFGGCCLCCWIANKDNIINDNKIMVKTATNKQRCFYAYEMGDGQKGEVQP
jgi:hypothetical protein